jgi:hypothetical protein
MTRLVISLTAVLLALSPASALERGQQLHTTPPLLPHPLPQGTPYFIVGGPSHVPIELRYAEMNGRRVLVEPTSNEVVYVLWP